MTDANAFLMATTRNISCNPTRQLWHTNATTIPFTPHATFTDLNDGLTIVGQKICRHERWYRVYAQALANVRATAAAPPPVVGDSPPAYEAAAFTNRWEGLRKICQWGLDDNETSPCRACATRIKGHVPESEPLLRYCSNCYLDMFPPTAESMHMLSRVCWVCDEAGMKRLADIRRRGKQVIKTCRVCGWHVGEGVLGEPEWKWRYEQPVCSACEDIPEMSFRQPKVPHPYEVMIDLDKIPLKRYSTGQCDSIDSSTIVAPNAQPRNPSTLKKDRHKTLSWLRRVFSSQKKKE